MPSPVIACFSSYSTDLVRELAGRPDVDVRVPAPGTERASTRRRQAVVTDLARDADIVIGDAARRYVLDRPAIAAMHCCRLIEQPSVGYNTVDVDAASAYGIPVANAPGYNTDAVADWVLMAILVSLRDGIRADAVMRAGQWPAWANGRELGALTVGIVGMGNIGSAVARRVAAFGSRVAYTSRRDHPGAIGERMPLNRLLGGSDIVTVHVPHTPDTERLIGAAQLASMRAGSLLVNASRGPVVDETALIDALLAGRPARAALDVFDVEPLPATSRLRTLDNVYLSPHIAANSEQARERVLSMVGENLKAVLAGRRAQHIVNPDAFV